jgi:RNA polymerase sigma-70 factor (ECF subfamily)
MDDLNAIMRLKEGDLSGLEDLVRRYQDKAIRVVFLIVQDEPLAEDIVTDTFLHIADHIGSFNSENPFEPYLMRSLVNSALNATRHLKLNGDSEADQARLEQLLSDAPSPEEFVEDAEFRRQVQQALRALAPRQRAVIVQRYYLQMSEQEMAQAASSPPGTIKWLLHKARRSLFTLLEKQKD